MQTARSKIASFIKRHRELQLQRNVVTYGVCLLIATSLWFLNALNKIYVTEISYPVRYTDFPKGKLLVSELPQEMTLEIKAHGFALLRYKISTSFLPIIFSINTYSDGIIEKNNLLSFTVNTAQVKERISAQLSQDIELLNIKPSSITFEFSQFVHKTLPVIPRINYSLKKQYILKKDVSVTPSTIAIEGPAAIVDTLQAIYTKPLNYDNLSKNIDKNIRLQEIQGVQFDSEEVRLQLEVERYTESRKTLPLNVINLPDSLQMRLFPGNIAVTFDVGLSHYDSTTDSCFMFYVDYNEISSSTTLTVHAGKKPKHIKDLVYSPEEVEYLIEKK